MKYAIIKPRRGTLYENSVNNVLLDEGELMIEVPDTGVGTGLCKFKIGDGVTRYNDLPYAFDGTAAASIYGGNSSEASVIQIRSDITENWEAIDPILADGELGYDKSYGWFKMGDGELRWTQLNWMRDVTFDEADPTQEIVDFGDEDIIIESAMEWEPDFDMVDFGDEERDAEYPVDQNSLSAPSVGFNLATGATEYPETILPEDWDHTIRDDNGEVEEPVGVSEEPTVDEAEETDEVVLESSEEDKKETEESSEEEVVEDTEEEAEFDDSSEVDDNGDEDEE